MDFGVPGGHGASDSRSARSVTATLNYVAPDSARNRLYVADGGHFTTTRYAPATVEIHDGRPHVSEFSLDASGFTLLRHESRVTDFGDPSQLDTVYTSEARDLVREATGADEVVPVGWVCRSSAPELAGGQQPPAPDVHVDVHPGRADARMEAASPRPGQQYRRAMLTSLWRAVSPPPQDTPLAVLDYRSVADDEGVPNLLLFVDRLPDPDDVPEIPDPDAHPAGSVFEHRAGHRWWYFPSMVPGEVLLLKLHDTDHSVAWRAPHTAFRDASARAANPRLSVEFRSIAFFF
jgi:hypothetical protein